MCIASPDLRNGGKPVLITGGCGFLGSNLASALAEAGQPVIALDNLSRAGAREITGD